MIVLADERAALAAGHAQAALAAAGVDHETASQIAVAVSAAALSVAWPQPELEFRLARALHQMGHPDAARTLLLRSCLQPAPAVAAAWLEAPPELLPLLRSGLLRPLAAQAWRLQAAALARPEVPHELAYVRVRHALALHLLPLWDGSRGRGSLELAGWRDHARLFHARAGAAVRCCRDWRRDFSDTLRLRGADRGWLTSPVVSMADPL